MRLEQRHSTKLANLPLNEARSEISSKWYCAALDVSVEKTSRVTC